MKNENNLNMHKRATRFKAFFVDKHLFTRRLNIYFLATPCIYSTFYTVVFQALARSYIHTIEDGMMYNLLVDLLIPLVRALLSNEVSEIYKAVILNLSKNCLDVIP